jgi:DNA-binding Lrp family transcriptional regulator
MEQELNTSEDVLLSYRVLQSVHEDESKNITQREIAKRVGRSPASVNFALRLLAVKGFIKISGANPRRLRYHITPSGMMEKARLAYNFFKRQRDLYEEARNYFLQKLEDLSDERVKRAAVYGWMPLTETVILFIISQGITVPAIYVQKVGDVSQFNRIPIKSMEQFTNDCDALVLTEPLPPELGSQVEIRKIECYPSE